MFLLVSVSVKKNTWFKQEKKRSSSDVVTLSRCLVPQKLWLQSEHLVPQGKSGFAVAGESGSWSLDAQGRPPLCSCSFKETSLDILVGLIIAKKRFVAPRVPTASLAKVSHWLPLVGWSVGFIAQGRQRKKRRNFVTWHPLLSAGCDLAASLIGWESTNSELARILPTNSSNKWRGDINQNRNRWTSKLQLHRHPPSAIPILEFFPFPRPPKPIPAVRSDRFHRFPGPNRSEASRVFRKARNQKLKRRTFVRFVKVPSILFGDVQQSAQDVSSKGLKSHYLKHHPDLLSKLHNITSVQQVQTAISVKSVRCFGPLFYQKTLFHELKPLSASKFMH